MEGNVAAAADAYQDIYTSAPSEKIRPEIRQKAAFRAGVCFEKLGLVTSARAAYGSVLKQGSGGVTAGDPSLLVFEATARLHGLDVAEAPGDPARAESSRQSESGQAAAGAASDSADVPVEVAVKKMADALRSTERARAAAVAALEKATAASRERTRDRRDLLARLAARGVSLSFPAEAPSFPFPADGPVHAVRDAVAPEADLLRLRQALADRQFERALIALRTGDRLGLSRAAHLALALLPGELSVAASTAGAGPGEWRAWLRWVLAADLDSAAGVAAARRRAVDEDLERKPLLLREIQGFIDSAASVEERRKDQAVQLLDKARELLDWARPDLREDPEMRRMADLAMRKCLYLARGCTQVDALPRLWSQVRRLAEALVARGEDLLDAMVDETVERGAATALGRPDASEACRGEMQYLMAGAREALGRSDPAAAVKPLRELALLVEWVPEADPLLAYRQALDSLRKEATSAEAATRKSDNK